MRRRSKYAGQDAPPTVDGCGLWKDARTRVVQRGQGGVRLTKIVTAHGVCLLLWAGKDDATTADAAWSGRMRGGGGCSAGKGEYDCTRLLRHTECACYFGRDLIPDNREKDFPPTANIRGMEWKDARTRVVQRGAEGVRLTKRLRHTECAYYFRRGKMPRLRRLEHGVEGCADAEGAAGARGSTIVQNCYGTRSVPTTLGGI